MESPGVVFSEFHQPHPLWRIGNDTEFRKLPGALVARNPGCVWGFSQHCRWANQFLSRNTRVERALRARFGKRTTKRAFHLGSHMRNTE